MKPMPKDLLDIKHKFEQELLDKNINISSVGTGYGLLSSKDDPNKARWMLFVYAETPDEIAAEINNYYEGFPVIVKNVPVVY